MNPNQTAGMPDDEGTAQPAPRPALTPGTIGIPPKNFGKKPTRAEHDERIEFTVWLLNRRMPKCQIKRQLMTKYGVDFRTCDRYVARAREQMVRQTDKTREELRQESYRLYESIIQDPASPRRDRMAAQMAIDHLFGLAGPLEHKLTGDPNRPVVVKRAEDYTDDELAAMITSAIAAESTAAGKSATGGP
jgi:hypothetical protein